MFTIEDARKSLRAAGVFFVCDDLEDDPAPAQAINLNDAMYWACSDAEVVLDEDLPRLADLHWSYGWCGVLYWVVVEKRGDCGVEFEDVKRQIEFVRNEESIRMEEPDPSKRAYLKRRYAIGSTDLSGVRPTYIQQTKE